MKGGVWLPHTPSHVDNENRTTTSSLPIMIFERLKQFRQEAYNILGRAKDATFELLDAVLLTPKVSSFVELSQSPVFRRKWPSIYEVLEDGRPPRPELMKLCIESMVCDERPLLAGDHTGWSRVEAVTLKDRTIIHKPTPIPGNKPISIGQSYSTIVWIPEERGSWALPLRHERITSFESPISKAAWQLLQVTRNLPARPISVWDSEYGCAPFVLQTAGIEADKLMKLRGNLCLWNAPPPYSGKGRPRVHGDKFKLQDPSTWGESIETVAIHDNKWGHLTLRRWSNLHFRRSPEHSMELLLIERMQPEDKQRKSKPMWLAWIGEQIPPLETIWRKYLRRFAVDHWYRFAKQRLHWTLPKLGTPEQASRWSDLMPLITWQLWLAREEVMDNPLPWQKSQTTLTPGRVAQSFPGVLAVIGTPAKPPKPRGKSPGWPKGKPRKPRIRRPFVKKGTRINTS